MTIWTAVFCLLSLGIVPSSAYASSPDDILDSSAAKKMSSLQLPQWNRILQTRPFENNISSPKIDAWNKFIASIQSDPKIRQLLKVNLWFQKFPYKQDNWVYGEDDYWASPAEFLERGGDCEDYAIIKYVTLRKLGFSADDMKIAMVTDVYSGTEHSFLIVNYEGAEFVLDNREKLVVSRYMKNRYRPLFAFNEETVWAYDRPKNAANKSNNWVMPGNR